MIALLLFLCLAQAPQPSAAPATTATAQANDASELQRKLVSIKRVYVETFGDDAIAKQMQAMIIAALTENKRFIITENKDKADALLRGTALEKTTQEFHGVNDKAAAGSASGGVGGSWDHGTGSVAGGFAARAVGIDDSTASTETIDHARVAVRLVSADGDVIWATTQESKGAKYKGASADVAEKIVKQLLRDIQRAEKPAVVTTPAK